MITGDQISQHLPSETSVWSKSIPQTNNLFLILSLLLVFGLDLLILISAFSLAGFWLIMLLVLTVFLVFYYFENNVFKVKFTKPEKTLDLIISILIILRNIVILLNFIPLIQILGMGIALYAGIPFFIIYVLLIWLRFRTLPKEVPVTITE